MIGLVLSCVIIAAVAKPNLIPVALFVLVCTLLSGSYIWT